MNASNIARLDEHARFHVREDREDYDATGDRAEHFYQAQGLVGDALNLAGLLLASLEDEVDARGMQMHTVVTVIEEKLKSAFNELGRHELSQAESFFAQAGGRDEGGD